MNNQQFQPAPSRVASLPGAWELIKKAIKVYQSRFWVFIGIMVIPFLATLLFSGLASLYSLIRISKLPIIFPPVRIIFFPVIFFIVAIAAFFALIIINLWSGVSLLYAIKEREQEIGIKESLAKGWHKIFSYWWISILAGCVGIGGYLLFIIPGIIFTIWFSLAFYVLVSEDIRGMNVLFRSRQLVKGYWWKIFWRFLVMVCAMLIVVLPVLIIVEKFKIPFIQNIINFLLSPLGAAFGFLLYENLKQLKGEVPFGPPKRKTKIGFILIGIIGAILLIFAIYYYIMALLYWSFF